MLILRLAQKILGMSLWYLDGSKVKYLLKIDTTEGGVSNEHGCQSKKPLRLS